MKFNLKQYKKGSVWSTRILKEEYDQDNFVVHNGERGMYCNYVPAPLVSQVEGRKSQSRWQVYLLHGIYPNFIFTKNCKRLAFVDENWERPDKEKAKEKAIGICKRFFDKGRFIVTDDDVVNAPDAKYSFNMKKHKTALHGLSPFNNSDQESSGPGSSWKPVDPYRPDSRMNYVYELGGDMGKKRREFDNRSNDNNTNKDPVDQKENLRHQDPLTDYNPTWKRDEIEKALKRKMSGDNVEIWQVVAPAGNNPQQAYEKLKSIFPNYKIELKDTEVGPQLFVWVLSIGDSLEVEKYLRGAAKMTMNSVEEET